MECPDVVPKREEQDRWDVAPLVKDVPQPVGLEFEIKLPLEAGQARGNAIPSGDFPDWLV